MINITKRNSLGLAVSMATFVESTVNDMCAGLLNFSNGGVDAMALEIIGIIGVIGMGPLESALAEASQVFITGTKFLF